MSPYQNIVCLTEESVEVLYALKLEHLIAGVSVYAKRPAAVKSKKKVSHFINANLELIAELNPDLVLGYSDLQKDIAKDLIGKGYNVWINNHRSIKEILLYIQALSNIVGAAIAGEEFVQSLQEKIIETKKISSQFSYRPRIYFEEWDAPMFSAIKWVSEILELCGGINIFADLAHGVLAKDREVFSEEVIARNPELIFCCWCGKKVDLESVKKRPGWEKISAVQHEKIIELPPEIFLQPGPAPILDGIDMILTQIKSFQS